MGMFIELRLDGQKCAAQGGCRRCAEVCPVDIFRVGDGRVAVAPENEDECTLCGLCLEACPAGAVELIKRYEVP